MSALRTALRAAGLPIDHPRMSDVMPTRKRRRGFARFDDDEVLAIRRQWEAGSAIVDIAAAYGVHRMTISQIVNYQRYTHLDPELEAAA